MRRIIVAGLWGALVLILWTFVVNGILRFRASIDMNRLSDERQVYAVLKEHILEPGRYVCNPAVTSEGVYPDGEPVFSISYGGLGHESAGMLMLIGLLSFLLAPTIGAWMLSQTSESTLSSYPRKVLFFVGIGVLFAIFTDLADFGIGGYPLQDAALLAANHIVIWSLMGLVIAWRIKPEVGA